jgi:O-antigen/teichoic acid export membrane protein
VGDAVISTTAHEPGLRGKVVTGLGWKLLSQVISIGSRVVLGIVLAHLLTPHDFGLAAMALVFTGLASILTDLALGAALVQKTTISEDDLATVFWTNLGAGLIISAIGVATASWVADFFSNAAVAPLFAASASLPFLFGLSVTQTALLTREMDFRSLEIRSMVATFGGMIVAIALALAGFGAWAVVGQAIGFAALSAALLWILSPWRPRLRFSGESFRTLGSFGGKTVVSRVLTYITLNGDNLLVGRFLGSKPLGIYSVAYNVMFAPMAQIAQPVHQVLFAAFVKVKDDRARLAQAWLRGNELACSLTVPLFLFVLVVAPDFVPVVLGRQWNAAVPVLQLLCLAGVAESFKMLNWAVLQATGRPGELLLFMTFSTLVTFAAFVVGLTWGVVGVAGLFAVARAISLSVYTHITTRALQIPVWRFVRLVGWVLRLSLPMAVCLYVSRTLLVQQGVAPSVRLIALSLLAGTVYTVSMLLLGRSLVAELRGMISRRRP